MADKNDPTDTASDLSNRERYVARRAEALKSPNFEYAPWLTWEELEALRGDTRAASEFAREFFAQHRKDD